MTKPTPPAAPNPPTTAADLLAAGQIRVKEDAEARVKPQAAVLATEQITAWFAKHPELHAALAKRAVEATFVGALGTLGGQLKTAVAAQPTDGREWELLTPEQKQEVTEAAEFYVDLKDSCADAATALHAVDDVRALGRGKALNRKSPQSVRDRIQDFLTNAPSRAAILAKAAVTTDDLDALHGHLAAIDALLLAKKGREGLRGELSGEAQKYALALDAGFALLRARLRLALKAQFPQEYAAAVALIPRAPERRSAPPTPPPAPAETATEEK